METETTTEGAVDTTNNEGEGTVAEADTIAVAKADYEKLNQTLGSLKRELKDLKKAKDEPKETPQKTNQPDEISVLKRELEGMALRTAGLTDPDDVDLAKKTAQKWNVSINEVLADDDFKVKLERQQTARANTLATSNIRGGAGSSQAKFTPEYWIAKGTPPSANDVPDRKARAKIAKAMIANTKSSKTFYSD